MVLLTIKVTSGYYPLLYLVMLSLTIKIKKREIENKRFKFLKIEFL
jgi:hypothetical protein